MLNGISSGATMRMSTYSKRIRWLIYQLAGESLLVTLINASERTGKLREHIEIRASGWLGSWPWRRSRSRHSARQRVRGSAFHDEAPEGRPTGAMGPDRNDFRRAAMAFM